MTKDELIQHMAEAMREAAETGMPTRVFKQVNFRSLAVAAYLSLPPAIIQKVLDD